MAKSTKYTALKRIINLNGKGYAIGETIKGLNADQEQRLQELGAIAPTEPIAPTEFADAAIDTSEGGEPPAE